MESAIELGALTGARPSARRPADMPDPLRSERRTFLIASVVTPIAALVGVALLVTGVGGESRFPGLLALIGLATPLFVAQWWQVSGTAASRIRAFAADNGFLFEELVDSPGHAGSTFALGTSQQRLMMVRGRMFGHVVELGNLRYRIGPRVRPIAPGYVAIRLPARLPHAVVTSRSVLRMRVNVHPRAEDRVALAGGSGRLRVFARPETEHLVRALLTGEVLAVVERLSGRYCVEIVGDMLFLHTGWPVSAGSWRRWRAVVADVADLCRVLDASAVWALLERQPARTLQSMARLESGLDEPRARRIIWLSFGALMIVITVLVVWWRNS